MAWTCSSSVNEVGEPWPIVMTSKSSENSEPIADPGEPRGHSFFEDLKTLTKLRLNVFVLITAFFGYFLARQGQSFEPWLMVHTLLGTAAAAFGAAVFNQLMEVEDDARMKRTADRPLPSRRMTVMKAFLIGWGLAAFGCIHLAAKVNASAAILAGITIATYVFIYTPLKKFSGLNTLVGAVPGALPPLIGWVGAGGGLWAAGGWFLFWLLFFWQLPHFVAISWLCRKEYEEAGYQMWSNGDRSGQKTVRLFHLFNACLVISTSVGAILGLYSWWAAVVLAVASFWKGMPVMKHAGERETMRSGFLRTLVYLPLALLVLAFSWR